MDKFPRIENQLKTKLLHQRAASYYAVQSSNGTCIETAKK